MKKQTIRTLESLLQQHFILSAHLPVLQSVLEHFAMAMTDQMAQLIDRSDANDPIAKQFIPDVKELNILPQERIDPIGDDAHQVVKGVIHRYPDRCLLMPVYVCPVYCRFCFRREAIGDHAKTLSPDELNQAFSYIQSHPDIWEVIITGGDPLILKPAVLKSLLGRLHDIDHVDVIRIHTRVPVVDSKRITAEMIAALSGNKTVYIVLHTNHVRELTPEALHACALLIDSGIPMLSQTTLLKNINDDIDVLSALMRYLIKHRIKPYYLHHADLVRGTAHFRTSIQQGQQLMKQLRGRFSGLCQPTYVLDIPGGYGKVPIGPCYIQPDSQYVIEDYQGQRHDYAETVLD